MATGTWGGGVGDYRVFAVKIQFTRGGQKCQTGFHIRDVGVATLSPEDVANEVQEFATTQFHKILAQGDTIDGVDAVNLVTKEGHFIAITGVGGLVTGEAQPAALAVSLALVGGIRARYANGRMLWPVAGEGITLGNTLYAPAVATYDEIIADMAARWMDDGVTATQRLVHLHEAKPERNTKQNKTLPALPASWYDVTAIKLNRTLTWLSSRRPGSGS